MIVRALGHDLRDLWVLKQATKPAQSFPGALLVKVEKKYDRDPRKNLFLLDLET